MGNVGAGRGVAVDDLIQIVWECRVGRYSRGVRSFEGFSRYLENETLAFGEAALSDCAAVMLGFQISYFIADDGAYRLVPARVGRSPARVLGQLSSDRSKVGDLSTDWGDLFGWSYSVRPSGPSVRLGAHCP